MRERLEVWGDQKLDRQLKKACRLSGHREEGAVENRAAPSREPTDFQCCFANFAYRLTRLSMRLFLISTITVVGFLTVGGQTPEPCLLTLDKAPSIRGIRLGMTISDVKAIYPVISEPRERDEVGTSATLYSPGIDDADERLKGLDSIFLQFFGGRVYHLSIRYKDPNHAQEIIELAKQLNFPKNDYARVTCQGFEVSIFRHSGSQTLDLTDTSAQRKIAKRLAEIEEDAPDCQKPPTIRGIELGMTVTKFRSVYTNAQIARKRNEVGELVLRARSQDEPRLKGISTLWAYFLDSELYFLVVDYSNQIEWKGIDQFVEQFSRRTGLRTKWKGYSEDRTLRCRRFVVKAEITADHPRVTIQDRVAVIKLNKREEELKSPSNFRP
jgi:hypothetical protein